MSDGIRRRDVLTGAALALIGGAAARAGVVKGELPWRPDDASPPPRVEPGPWQFFTAEELPTIEAIADRIIPPDPETAGGKDAGCVVFLDAQVAAAATYVRNSWGHAAGRDAESAARAARQSPSASAP